MKQLLLIMLAAVALAAPTPTEANIERPEQWQAIQPFSATIGGPTAPDGTQVQCDLPLALHMKNIGGSDGAGLCTMTSINMAAFWHNEPMLYDFQKWSSRRPGGGYPSKIDSYIDAIAKEKNEPKPAYRQIESSDPEILKQILKTGRYVSITYYRSPAGRYGGSRIAHMVNLVHLDETWACYQDNNFPKTFEWCPARDFRTVSCGNGGKYWAFVFLKPGPPPVPKN